MKAHLLFVSAIVSMPVSVSVFAASDPGPRGGAADAGGPVAGLSDIELKFFNSGKAKFLNVESVSGTEPGTQRGGLGPRFNANSCVACHAQPTVGGSSPFENPQPQIATAYGAKNKLPFFMKADGPVLEVRFKFHDDGSRDGGVHDVFTITGRQDAGACEISQPDFEAEAAKGNLTFRIPTPVFGDGLLEAIPDAEIVANRDSDADAKRALGIYGRENRSGNDGSITRFGWKAQNKSIGIFAGEAYNVEIGVTNDLFPDEREEANGCMLNPTPEDHSTVSATDPLDVSSDVVQFTQFMQMLAPPHPGQLGDSEKRGLQLFSKVGCVLCHTQTMTTGLSNIAGLSNKKIVPWSDLLLHHMGPALADDVIQGDAGSDEFRTAPLWGLGQRVFFMHDGRTKDLVEAIRLHGDDAIRARRGGSDCDDYAGARIPREHFACHSEAAASVDRFNALEDSEKQDVLNFLRAL